MLIVDSLIVSIRTNVSRFIQEMQLCLSLQNGGEFFAGSNIPLRGSKTSVYEAGTRTPAMFHSPLASAKGVRASGLFHITDWHATIVAMAGADLGDSDGVDQSQLLFLGEDSERDEVVYNIDSVFPGLFGSGAIRLVEHLVFRTYSTFVLFQHCLIIFPKLP